MSTILFLIAFALPAEAKKYSAEDLARRSQAENEIRKARDDGQANLPPCDAQRSLTAAMARHEPPASCPEVLTSFRQFQDMQTKYISLCEDFDRLADELLAEPAVWAKDQAKWPKPLAARHLEIKKSMGHAAELTEDDFPATTIQEWEAYENGEGIGTLADWRCGFALGLALQARKVQTTWFSLNETRLSEALYSTDPNSADRRAYEAYRRGGDRAYEEAQPINPIFVQITSKP